MALARQGDADAFDQLVTRHQHAVYRTTLAALRDREDAEEAAQDALVRAWSSLGRFRSESSFRTWLLAIAWNCALRRRRSVVQWLRRRAPVDEAHMVAVTGSNPEMESADRALRVVVAAEIERLTPKLRDALLLAQSGGAGSLRSSGTAQMPERAKQMPGFINQNVPVELNVDVKMPPYLPKEPAKIRARIGIEYQPFSAGWKDLPGRVRAQVDAILDAGKKMTLSHTTDPVTGLRTMIEVTATVMK